MNLYSSKNKIIAIVLCLFLGGLGVHRMYIGRVMSGLVMLGLTILGAILAMFGIGFINGLVSFWALIDLIRICIGHLTDGENKALKF